MYNSSYYFNPVDFNTDEESDSSIDDEIKENSYKVKDVGPGIERLDVVLPVLKEAQNQNTRKLKGIVSENYEEFKAIARCLKNTSEYKIFYDKVREYFQFEKNLEVGTINRYMKGCMIKNDPCSFDCATGLESPDNSECDQRIIIAEKGTNEYIFNLAHDINNESNKAKVYITNCSSVKDFKGFNTSECLKLKELGGTNIKIYGVPKKGNTNIELTEDYVNCELIKPKIVIEKYDNDNNKAVILIVVLILLILIILFVGWNMLYRK